MIDVTRRSDLRLLEQSIRNRWELPDRTLADLPARLLEIVIARDGTEPDSAYIHPTRTRLSAIRCLLAMNGQNIASDPPAQSVDVNIKGRFEFDEATAAAMSRDDMAKVSDAMRLLRGSTNGNGSAHH